MEYATTLLYVLTTFAAVIYYILEAIILSIVPKRFRFKDISSETVLITGGGNGIGRQLARRFSKLAAKVVLLDINVNDLNETMKILENEGASSEIFTYECDVSNREIVYAVADKIRKEVGKVTILVNNAGVVSGRKLLDIPDGAIKKTLEINSMAHFWMCKAFLPDMMDINHGHIVSIASVAGHIGAPKLTDYCASKFAAVGLMEALREEILQDGYNGIKLSTVAPYHITTALLDGFRTFLKSYSPEWAAGQIVSGVLTDQEEIFVPSFFCFMSFLLAILPRKAIREVNKYTGLMTCMDEFKGLRDKNLGM